MKRHDLDYRSNNGPIFHRWLPNGQTDAIKFYDENINGNIRIWHKRWGVVKDGEFQFEYNKEILDEELILEQIALEAGPLYGDVQIEISDKELSVLNNDDQTSEIYLKLGKIIVKNVIHNHVIRYAEILRIVFGQYWLDTPDYWDSRKMSIGEYCHRWNMRWKLIEDANFKEFIPNERKNEPIVVKVRAYNSNDWLTKEDWVSIEKLMSNGYEPTFACKLLSRAHEFAKQRNWNSAFVEGVTALEVAVDEWFNRSIGDDKVIKDSMKMFWELPLRTRVTNVILGYKENELNVFELLKGTYKAIEIRNKIVHDGYSSIKTDYSFLRPMFSIIKLLLENPQYRIIEYDT